MVDSDTSSACIAFPVLKSAQQSQRMPTLPVLGSVGFDHTDPTGHTVALLPAFSKEQRRWVTEAHSQQIVGCVLQPWFL